MELLAYIVLNLLLITVNSNTYENKLTKLWSMQNGPQKRTVVDVQSEYIVEPGSETSDVKKETLIYFKPRSIPLSEPQIERTARYSDIKDSNQFKTEILFPGNYFPIAEVKKENDTYNPLEKYPFRPKIIPLLREQQYGQGRSFDGEAEIDLEEQPTAMRRSYVYFDDLDDEDDEGVKDLEDEDEDEVDEDGKRIARKKGPKLKKKYMKYMLPLLLAYKLKFFTLIPLLMGGLVLLTGATGMAGFFFALFAAVMGLSKGLK